MLEILTQIIIFSIKSLEDTVDKWLHDLNEQEKIFLNQASQVNMWDRQLIENGEKISETHNEVYNYYMYSFFFFRINKMSFYNFFQSFTFSYFFIMVQI